MLACQPLFCLFVCFKICFYLCVCMCVCMRMSATHVQVGRGTEEGIKFHEAGLNRLEVTPHRCWEQSLDPLEEQSVILPLSHPFSP